MRHWWNSLLSGEISTHVNSSRSFLIEKSIQKRLGILSFMGSLAIEGKETSHSPPAQVFIVRDGKSEELINWKKDIQPLTGKDFFDLRTHLLKRIHLLKPEIFIFEGKVQVMDTRYIGLNLISTSPVGALFFHIMIKPQESIHSEDHYVIYHDPDLTMDLFDVHLKSTSLMAINLSTKEILIIGHLSLGEIKEGIQSLMSILLPQHGGLPMGARGFKDHEGNGFLVIEMDKSQDGEDLTNDGFTFSGHDQFYLQGGVVQNLFEGAYLKESGVKEKSNEGLLLKYHQFGNMFEGIQLDEKTRDPLLETQPDKKEGHFIFSLPDFWQGPYHALNPSFLFLFYEDFSGVFPLLGLLEKEEALSSLLFTLHQTPHALSPLNIYEHLLSKYLDSHSLQVWRLNIGVEKIKDRSLIPSTLREVLKKKGKFHFYQHSIFPILVPTHMDHVSEKFLMPEKFWKKKHDYREVALREKKQFAEKLQDVI